MKILIGIPAFNESQTISKVLRTIPKKIAGVKPEIIVCDDGSQDATGRLAEKEKALVLSHLINRGLGGSLKTILGYAGKIDADIAVTLDADGQHKGEDIPSLIEPLLKGDAEFVAGSRWRKGPQGYILRYFVNMFANFATFALFGFWSSDSQSGFRAFSKKAIKSIKLTTDGMEVSSEFFREARRLNLKYSEVDIRPVYSDYSINKGQSLFGAPDILFQLFIRLLK